MRVIKDYGVVIDHGSTVLKFLKTDEGVCLAGYKDGMRIREYPFTKDEIKQIYKILCEHLDYEPTKVGPKDDIVSVLTSVPATDLNFRTALNKATGEQLTEAIKIIEKQGGRNKTKLNALRSAFPKVDGKSKEKASESKENKAETKVDFRPLDESKKPKIIPFTTKGADASYEDCVAKLDKETELFKDASNQYVIEAIKERCLSDADFRANVARKDKTYQGFYIFMFNAAANGYCDRSNNVGCLDGNRAIELAFDYYNADTKAMEAEAKKKREEEAAKRKAEAEKKKKEAKANGKTNQKKKEKAS